MKLSSPAQTLGSWFRILLKAWMCVCVRQRTCDGLILRPRSRTFCLRLRNWSETKHFTDILYPKWEQRRRRHIILEKFMPLISFKSTLECKYCHVSEWLYTGFGLMIGFIFHLQIVTASNYNALADSCTRLFTAAHTKPSQHVFTSRFLVTDPNNVLCLRPNWLKNISQLTPRLATISHQLPTFLIG
jgi:hypothetical protein